jgi:pyruvate kinase
VSRRRRLRSTKVVATIGPACSDVDTIRRMIEAGMNVARLNLSHGTHAEHTRLAELVREASRKSEANIAIMMDTKGTEIRTGEVAGGAVTLAEGDVFTLTTDARLGDARGVSVSHAGLPQEVQPGQRIFVDDGTIELRVDATARESIRCTVLRGGELGSRKGVNIPGAALSLAAMGPADLEDLLFAVEQGIDYLALSFVRSAADVLVIREILRSRGARVPLIAKIESREGVEKLDEIIDAADGTMVARGDLGVELPVEQVPLVQKRIIRGTVRNGKPVITATQMLDSMERNARPTRAEASDVANAILDGTSAVMLSGETAKGRYPVEAVRTMASLALAAESSLGEYGDLQQIRAEPANVVTEAVAQAAVTMARRLDAAAILTLTESGYTSRSISKYRPDCPILAVSSSPEVVRKLALNWGVTGLLYEGEESDTAKTAFAVERAREICAEPGDVVVVTAGISREAGSTNLIRVVTV